MRQEFVDRIAAVERIQRKDMIEKDILLHQLLLDLSKDEFFSSNFLFKGGTCLIKHHLGYFRFSEDIDFTWRRQDTFAGKKGRQLTKDLREIIGRTGETIGSIASNRELDFKWQKDNRDYVELVSRGKVCTFKVHYNSVVLKRETILKIQINFVDAMCREPNKGNLQSIVKGRHDELKALFDEYGEYVSAVPFAMYDIKDILSEKVRALLTRRVVKARDFVDVFFIWKRLGISVKDVEDCTIKKINFALENYERFRTNFESKKGLLDKGEVFRWGEERSLLIQEISETEFNHLVDGFTEYLKSLVKKISS